MGSIEELYDELESELSFEDFTERVEKKIEEMGGLADEETAAMLVVHEIDGDRPIDIADVQPEMEVATILGVVRYIGDVRTFERDDGSGGAVLNVEIADESGQLRAAFWDDRATAAREELDRGDVLRIRGRPREGMNGVELSVTDVRLEDGLDLEIAEPDASTIAELEEGMEGIGLVGEVLRIDEVRTFERNDGSEGRVGTIVIGDASGSIAVSAWDDASAQLTELTVGEVAHIVDAGTRERDGRLEAHVGARGRIEPADAEVSYEPNPTPIETLTEGDLATIAGIVRSTDPVRTFDRRDGSEGRVRNVRLQDETGSIRVALWDDRADIDVAPGDGLTCIDVSIQEGYRDDIEASANWRSTVVMRDVTPPRQEPEGDEPEAEPTETGTVEFTGTVVQPGDPIIIDDGSETVRVDWHGDVQLGERVTVMGRRTDDRIDATSLEPASRPG